MDFMKQIHLIMSFMRHHLKDTLIAAYGPMDIIWHPIVFQNEMAEFNEPWIIPHIIPMNREECPSAQPQYTKTNHWIQNNEIVDEDYYVTVADDDMYEDGVFDEIKKMEDDIVIISMKRGYHIPPDVIDIRKYPTGTLIADPEWIRRGFISAQQSFVKGKIFRKHLFDDTTSLGDGDMAVLHKQEGEQAAYRPDLFALFNFYEPGRWTKYKIFIGAMINDMMRLDMCLKQSDLPGSLNVIINPDKATAAMNKLLDLADYKGAEIAVLVHQDMYFRNGWLQQAEEQLAMLPPDWIVAGIIGKDLEGNICGKFHDMRIAPVFNTSDIHTFPQAASCFDECCIIVNLKSGFRFDERLDGFDLYGTLAVLQAREMGGTAWIIDAFAEHYCLRPFTWFPDKDFQARFKWLHKRFPNALKIDTTVLGVPNKNEKAA
jgi:hypothetical protein